MSRHELTVAEDRKHPHMRYGKELTPQQQETITTIQTALQTTAHKFANAHGLNRTTIFNLLNEDRRPNVELIEKICVLEPRISAEFLLRGEGEPLRDLTKTQTKSAIDHLQTVKVKIVEILETQIHELEQG